MDERKKGFQSLIQIFSDRKNKVVLEDTDIKEMIGKVQKALFEADVDIKIAKNFGMELEKTLDLSNSAPGYRHKMDNVKCAVIKGLEKLLTPVDTLYNNDEHTKYVPIKGKRNVIVFLGLNGVGKTSSIVKYGLYYKNKGFKVLVVGVDTFRAGAMVQLEMNCKMNSLMCHTVHDTFVEPDEIIDDVFEKYNFHKKDDDDNKDHHHRFVREYDMVLIDTAGRYKQDKGLEEEMKKIMEAATPEHIVLVLDGTIGKGCYDQAVYFKQFGVGSIILTKMDQAKGGGALAAVIATNSPVKFICVGEHVERDFEEFDPKKYVGALLGFGDMKRLMNLIQLTEKKQGDADRRGAEQLAGKFMNGGKFTFRDFLTQIKFIQNLSDGKVSSISSLIPDFNKCLVSSKKKGSKEKVPTEAETDELFEKKMKKSIVICDSLSETELENDERFLLNDNDRLERIARGAGVSLQDIQNAIEFFKPFKALLDKMKKLPKNAQHALRKGQMPDEWKSANSTGSGGIEDIDIQSMMESVLGKKKARDPRLQRELKNRLASKGLMPTM